MGNGALGIKQDCPSHLQAKVLFHQINAIRSVRTRKQRLPRNSLTKVGNVHNVVNLQILKMQLGIMLNGMPMEAPQTMEITLRCVRIVT
jgi:hypothetical protein